MRPLKIWLKLWVTWTSGLLRIAVSRAASSSEAVAQRYVTCRGHNGCIDSSPGAVFEGIPASWLGSESQSQWHINRLELFSTAARTLACTDTHRHHVCGLVNKSPSGVPSRALCKQAADLLLWVDVTSSPSEQRTSRSRRADMLSRKGDSSRRVEVAFGTSTGERRWICSPWARRRMPAVLLPVSLPAGRGRADIVLASSRLYVFPPIQILPLVLYKSGRSELHVILIAPEPALVPRPDRTAGGTALADPHQEGFASPGGWLGVAPRTRSCGAFMCGCFGDIREAERTAFSCARYALGGASTLYETFGCLKMGSVCEMVRSASYRPGYLHRVGLFWVFYSTGWIVGSLPSTLKVYLAASASFRSPQGRQSIGGHHVGGEFFKGARRLHSLRPPAVPPWGLEVGFRGSFIAAHSSL